MKTIWNNYGTIKLLHIDVHQDLLKFIVSGLAGLIIIANHLATNGLNQSLTKDIIQIANKATLYLNNQKVTSNYTGHLMERSSATEMYKYYANKYNWY
jgi:hypothetical protein